MISNVTDSMKFSVFTEAFSRLQDQSRNIASQISTGKRIGRSADDPEGTKLVLSMTGQSAAIDAYRGNIVHAKTWVQSAATTLGAVEDFLVQAQELARNGLSADAAERSRSAETVQDISGQVLSFANTRINGNFLFSGSLTDVAPFSAGGALPTDPPYDYNGNNASMTISVGKGAAVEYNLPGDSVFLGADGGVDIFQTLKDLETALQNDDSPAVTAAAEKLADAVGQIREGIEKTSLMLSDLAIADSRLAERQTVLATQIEKIESADISELAMEFQTQALALNASYEAALKTSELSLLNFLE